MSPSLLSLELKVAQQFRVICKLSVTCDVDPENKHCNLLVVNHISEPFDVLVLSDLILTSVVQNLNLTSFMSCLNAIIMFSRSRFLMVVVSNPTITAAVHALSMVVILLVPNSTSVSIAM